MTQKKKNRAMNNKEKLHLKRERKEGEAHEEKDVRCGGKARG